MAHPHITYRIDHANEPANTEWIEAVFERACKSWSAAGPVSFRPAGETEKPMLEVAWKRANHGPCRPFGIDTAVAHTTTTDGLLQIHLDLDRTWKRDGFREGLETPLYQTLLHELGHVLGLGHTPDENAILATDPKTERIQRSDRDGLWTLYAEVDPGPNDYAIYRDDKLTAVLYGLRVEGASEAQFFDADGNGRDELVVWRMDPLGFGQLVAFFFEGTSRPVRTMGPRYGMVDGMARVTLVITETEERLVVLDFPNGKRLAHIFDENGVPVAFKGVLPKFDQIGARRSEGDLDGDGERESVLR